MGESTAHAFEPSFNLSVKLRSSDDRLSSDAGALLSREADESLGLTASIASRLQDPRDPKRIRYSLLELIRERVYALAQGYRAYDDLDRVAHDPVMRLSTWDRRGDRVLDERLASQPTLSRTLSILTQPKNREALRKGLGDWVMRHLETGGRGHRAARGTLDVDSLPVTARGLQEGSAYNGYYQRRVLHPLVAGYSVEGDFQHNRVGDGFVHAILRKGNASSAQGALRFIRQAVRRCAPHTQQLDVRFDSAFANGTVMDGLTEDGTPFVGLLALNQRLKRIAAQHLRRSPGRPPKVGYETVLEVGEYQAGRWKHALLLPVNKRVYLPVRPRF